MEVQHWVLDEAPVAAHVFVIDLAFAHVALVLNFDEVDIDDEAAHFDDVPDDGIRGNRFEQLNAIVGSEVIYFFLHAPDHFEIVLEQLLLHIDVQIVRNLAQSISNEHHLILLHEFL